jgi:formylglycine-generating enzyme required for sulfatase activity
MEEAKLKQMEKDKLKLEEDTKFAAIETEMVLIPEGKFKMGSPASEAGRSTNEKQHEVILTNPFYMGKYEVTQEQYEGVMGNNPSSRTKGAKLPVTNVSWADCQEFIKKLNAKTNGRYRLPTEAEWEYACRAGTSTVYSFGDSLTRADANYGNGTSGSIKPVGSYDANAFGLYDMHGNVIEWCEDWYGDYRGVVSVTDPKGPVTGTSRVLRGGSFIFSESAARSSYRGDLTPANGGNGLGFRLARTADAKAAVAPEIANPKPAEIMPATGDLLVTPFDEAKIKELQKSAAKSLQKEVEENADLGKGIKLEMVLIPAGKFMMGSPVTEQGRSGDEKQHEVTLTKPFCMGKHEVTQEQWEGVMGKNPCSRDKGAKLPVTDVSWVDCQEFIKKLNEKTSGGYRLPTEAEWEYACRAGTTAAYSVGNSLTKADANIEGDSIKAVGSYKPNAFGIYDMHGNVWEWCEDWYGDYPAGAVKDPKGPGTSRVLRGGSFGDLVSVARSSYRALTSPSNRYYADGFRLARTADVKAAVAPAIPNPKPAEIMPTPGDLLVAPFSEARAKEVQKSVAKILQKEVEEKADLGKGIKLDLVLIPAGKFMMGSPASENGRDNNETQHEATLTKPFYMGKYEVTQEQWEGVMGNNPSSRTKGAKLPVTDVSWEDCQEFIKKFNASTKGGYRLPTEAEWEYACRAGTTTAYSYGNVMTKSDANFGYGEVGAIRAVGSYNPNTFGLYDMHGNVWEWCEDRYGEYPAGAVTDPRGPATGERRVLRGGSFGYDDATARSSARTVGMPTGSVATLSGRHDCYGFRLARTP